MIKKLSISNSEINDDNINSLLGLNWPELTNLTLSKFMVIKTVII